MTVRLDRKVIVFVGLVIACLILFQIPEEVGVKDRVITTSGFFIVVAALFCLLGAIGIGVVTLVSFITDEDDNGPIIITFGRKELANGGSKEEANENSKQHDDFFGRHR